MINFSFCFLFWLPRCLFHFTSIGSRLIVNFLQISGETLVTQNTRFIEIVANRTDQSARGMARRIFSSFVFESETVLVVVSSERRDRRSIAQRVHRSIYFFSFELTTTFEPGSKPVRSARTKGIDVHDQQLKNRSTHRVYRWRIYPVQRTACIRLECQSE